MPYKDYQPYLRPQGNPVPNPTFTLQKGTLYPTLPSPSRREPCTHPTFTLQKGTLYPTLPSPSRREPNPNFALLNGTLYPTLTYLPEWNSESNPTFTLLDLYLVTSRREPCNPTIPSPSRRLEGNLPNHTFTLQKGTLDPTLTSPS